jgi:hypothetical protein
VRNGVVEDLDSQARGNGFEVIDEHRPTEEAAASRLACECSAATLAARRSGSILNSEDLDVRRSSAVASRLISVVLLATALPADPSKPGR